MPPPRQAKLSSKQGEGSHFPAERLHIPASTTLNERVEQDIEQRWFNPAIDPPPRGKAGDGELDTQETDESDFDFVDDDIFNDDWMVDGLEARPASSGIGLLLQAFVAQHHSEPLEARISENSARVMIEEEQEAGEEVQAQQ